MAQDNKQTFFTGLVTAFVIVGVILIAATLISGVADQGNTSSNGRPVITRAFNSEFLTLSAPTRPAATTPPPAVTATARAVSATPPATRTPVPTIED